MTTLNEYNESIRKDIALEFGLEAGGYAPTTKIIPLSVAARIAAKYPSDLSQGRFSAKLNPKAVTIAKRYMSLVMGVK